LRTLCAVTGLIDFATYYRKKCEVTCGVW